MVAKNKTKTAKERKMLNRLSRKKKKKRKAFIQNMNFALNTADSLIADTVECGNIIKVLRNLYTLKAFATITLQGFEKLLCTANKKLESQLCAVFYDIIQFKWRQLPAP